MYPKVDECRYLGVNSVVLTNRQNVEYLTVVTRVQSLKQNNVFGKLSYKLGHRPFTKTQILIGLYDRERRSAELKTANAVARCQAEISSMIEKSFSVLDVQLNERFLNVPFDSEFKDIYLKAQGVISAEFTNRFHFTAIDPLIHTDFSDFNVSWGYLLDWKQTKEKTISITEQVEKWSRRTWNMSFDVLFQNQISVEVLSELNLNGDALRVLGVSSLKEKAELRQGLKIRIQGVLTAIKSRMLEDLNNKVALMFYRVHDKKVDKYLVGKIMQLEEKQYNEENWGQLNLIEA